MSKPLLPEDPLWLDEYRYQTVWKGEVVTVDIREIKPLRISDQFLRDSAVDVDRLVRRLNFRVVK